MKNLISLAIVLFTTQSTFAHKDGHHHNNYKEWVINNHNTPIKASYLMFKEGLVFLDTENGNVLKYPLSAFAKEDQIIITQKNELIQKINYQTANGTAGATHKYNWNISVFIKIFWALGIVLFFLSILLFISKMQHKTISVSTTVLSIFFLTLASCSMDDDSTDDLGTYILDTDAAIQAFGIFDLDGLSASVPGDGYIHVESTGFANHVMMKGIINWNLQVPFPRDYTGDRVWKIKINRELTGDYDITSITGMGSIGIAVNGVPIFDASDGTGILSDEHDTVLNGEADVCGGHSGRGMTTITMALQPA